MKPTLRFAPIGKYYREIEVALKRGYVLVKRDTFPSPRVVLKLQPAASDKLKITSFEDATYFMSGGFPKPHMVACDSLTVTVGKTKEDAVDELYSKMQLGWIVQSLSIGRTAVLVKERAADSFCHDISLLEDAIYAIQTSVKKVPS
jgi:hypothetical protein